MNKTHNWTEFMEGFQAKWAIAPNCPFCGANTKKLHSWWTRHGTGGPNQRYAIQCNQCGCQAATGETPEEAIDEWSRRTTSSYQPLGPHSYVLPMQALGNLLVHENGRNVSFIDWVDEEIHNQIDVDLGDFRICYRHRGEKRDEKTYIDRPKDS